MSTRFKKLALATALPGIGLVLCASHTVLATDADDTGQFVVAAAEKDSGSRTLSDNEFEYVQDQAIQQLSEHHDIMAERLRVINSAEINFPRTGKTVIKMKVLDETTGQLFETSLNPSGQAMNLEMIEDEENANSAEYAKIHPMLAMKLANVIESPERGDSSKRFREDSSRSTKAQKKIKKREKNTGHTNQEKLRVILWLHETEEPKVKEGIATKGNRTAAKNLSFTKQKEIEFFDPVEDVDEYVQQVDIERAAVIEQVVAPIAESLRGLDPELATDKLSPAIYATLTPEAIIDVAQLPEVAMVYEDTINYPELEVARSTTFTDVVENRGITGDGVRVAQIEIGGRVATNNPFLSGTVQDANSVCNAPSSHSTAVAGIIRSTHTTRRGIAPDVQLRAAGSCEGFDSQLQSRSTAAANWGARAINLSWGANIGLTPGASDRFYDDMVINQFRTVVKSAGNEGGACRSGSGNVSSPGLAYNVITVGNFSDNNTLSLGDDTMSSCSSWRNPVSTHNDREKPEVAAPGTRINSTTTSSPWTGAIGSGTSFSAPVVTGIAALLMERHSSLRSWPEAVKAIIMTTALHNIEGSSRLSERDGAGGVYADWADDVADKRTTSGPLGWGAQSYSCSTQNSLDVATMSLTAGVRTRATIVWDQNPSYTDYASKPSADLDLHVIDPSGNLVDTSSSWDNTYEIVEFTPANTGNYKLRVRKHRCDLTPRWLGYAWRKG